MAVKLKIPIVDDELKRHRIPAIAPEMQSHGAKAVSTFKAEAALNRKINQDLCS